MNQNNSEKTPVQPPPNPAPAAGKWILKAIIVAVVVAVLAVTGYSVYVAKHEPDPQETIVLGQTRLAAGSPAAFRVLVRNRVSAVPVKGAEVAMSLTAPAGQVTRLGVFRTDDSGSIAEPVKIPELAPGEYQLVIDSRSPLGADHIVRKIDLQNPARVLLSSDKPVYQPGQTIHLRSLILNERTQKPFGGEPVTFEVSDPKGNKIFKETRKTSAFGIAWADFVLADELNLGRCQIRALAGGTTGERTVEVKRYVLPKIKIQIATDRSYYLPGQTVSGSVQAAYFFGKPVAGGEVKLIAATLQEQPVTVTEIKGRVGADGAFPFRFVLPDFFAGLPQKDGNAFLDLTAEVRDGGGHAETKTLSLTVARNELEIVVIPEAGTLVPGVENILYILTTYPDGRPAPCRLSVDGVPAESDAAGVCLARVVPSAAAKSHEITAMDTAGHRRSFTYTPEKEAPSGVLLLRTDRAVYQAAETVHLNVLSPEKDNTIFLDLIKDGQTVLTKSVPLKNHQAAYILSLPGSLVGCLQLNAYMITDTGEDRGCSRTIYVNPASGLRIDARTSRPVYRPGETARMEFTVTDAAGRPAPAALGIAAVDESVFALAENHPGLLQEFLDVEAELMKPRYQIKSFASPAEMVAAGNGNLAQACFASLAEPRNVLDLDAMVKQGNLPEQIVDQVRSLRDSPAYASLQKDPQYADILRAVDGEGSLYNLRDATGPAKLRAVEAQRKAYFSRLKSTLGFLFVIALLLWPVVVAVSQTRAGAGIFPKSVNSESDRQYVEMSASNCRLLGLLTVFPYLFYPLGAFIGDQWRSENFIWILWAMELAVVSISLAGQAIRHAHGAGACLPEEWRSQRAFFGFYWGQFMISRLGFALAAVAPGRVDGMVVLGLIFGSVLVPLFVLYRFNEHLRGRLLARGLESPAPKSDILGILLIIAMIFILGAMLLPALAKAKSKAQSVSLMSDLRQIELARQMAADDATKAVGADSPQPRVRRDFPETLCWQPELITDDHGWASLEIPLADSITTWRASIDGVSAAGQMASAETPITVFQDFFVDLDLPVSLSLGDEVSVPVTCYNYLKEPQDLRLTLASANWFDAHVNETTVHLGTGEVKSARFVIKAGRVGTHTMRVVARGTKLADAVEREVRIVPVGQQVEHTRNEVLKTDLTDLFAVPANANPDSSSLLLKIYPSRFSEVVEGLDSIFEEPHGCFEQTSSTTYPNVLALDYLKRMGRLTPETEVRARKLINAGYQRLLTFEVPGGGFEWFGRSPAHVGLTAYGVMEFTDMSRVQTVDEGMLERTKKWLYSRQNSDGSWDAASGLDEWSGASPVTPYVVWALAESGDHSAALDRGLNFLHTHQEKLSNAYEKALAANAFLAGNPNDAIGISLVKQLEDDGVADKDSRHWHSSGRGLTYSRDMDLDVQTTALCAMALMKAGIAPESVKQALHWISSHKSREGCWGSTQATILAMRALILGSTASLGQNFESSITISLNGRDIETFQINKSNSDVMKQVSLTKHLQAGENRIELRQTAAGELPIQITGSYWVTAGPEASATTRPPGALQIDVQYDRATLAVDDQLACAVTVKNNAVVNVNMAIVDLGIPPGFDVDTSAFETMQANGQLAKFEATGNQVILYLRELSAKEPLRFSYTLLARYLLRVETPPSAVYEYYQPQNRAESRPVTLQVAGAP